MSIICLICKDKLLNGAPGSSVGSLNSLVENQVITTGCGHLYHCECLQSWFRTQKKKLQNQGVTGNIPDYCPTCQVEVYDDQLRRIYLLEDHRDALEKAKLLEKVENLEIYCHQLEIHVQQLRRENDLLLNKVLAPPSSMTGKEEFSTIVKNDRVVWLKKDSIPLSGIVLSIFKKDGALWVKLKLDKKIRQNQRSGLLGSFRFDKKQEWTVLFEEIVLEKDFKTNNVIHEHEVASEPSTPTIFSSPNKMPSFRSSTLSLPGEYMSPYFLGMDGMRMKPVASYEHIHSSGSTMDLSGNSPVTQSIPVSTNNANVSSSDSFTNLPVAEEPSPQTPEFTQRYSPIPVESYEDQDSGQRDYVIIGAGKSLQSQDAKTKHVTFAEDLERHPQNTAKAKGNHVRDRDYNNVTQMDYQQENLPPVPERPMSHFDGLQVSVVEGGIIENNESNDSNDSSALQTTENAEELQMSTINLTQPSVSSTSSSPLVQTELQTDVFIDPKFPSDIPGNGDGFNKSCFDITFTALFHGCEAFDRTLLLRDSTNDSIQQTVQHILKDEFVTPYRHSQEYLVGYSSRLYDAIAHLCSSFLDLEELMTILFEYVFKMPPFISYSYDMCDYIHQFFIDFTDKAKRPSVQQLFERSLSLQDNLKLRDEPSPALILQMPNSEEGIIHYEAVIPSRTLNIEQLLEKDSKKPEAQPCYCNKVATLECETCTKIHGKSPVLFCEDCSVLLEAIHDQMYHKLELVPIKAINMPSTTLELAAVICLKNDRYTAFLRDAPDHLDRENWRFIYDFENGRPKMEELPDFDKWLESISSDNAKVEGDFSDIQYKLLTECRMFLYLPSQNSFA